MRVETHFAGGLAAGVAMAAYLHLPPVQLAPVLAVAAVGALLPDIDHAGSAPNHALGLAGKVTAAMVSHRSVTHSLAFCAVIAFVMYVLHAPMLYTYAALAGMASHLLLDSLNPRGVPWLWPFGKHISTAPLVITTGSAAEKVVVLPVLYASVIYLLFQYFTKGV